MLVFAKGEKEREAREAGADFAGATTWWRRSHEGFMDFDRVIATPDMMGAVGKLGRILGPRGLMPNPKVGTVTFDVGNAVNEAKAGKIEYRVEKAGIVHARIGKVSFAEKALADNAMRAHQRARSAKPSTAKGIYLRSITVSSTMGPGVQDRPGARSWARPRRPKPDGTRQQRHRRSARSRRRFDKMTSAVFLDFKGMTVENVTQASRRVPQGRRRVQGRQEHARQAGPQGHSRTATSSTTPSSAMTGIAWSYEDPSAAAKVVKAFRKDAASEKLKIKAASSRARSSTAKAVEDQLATMPGKDELRAMLLATLQAPLQQLRRAAPGPAQNFVYVLAAKERQG